MFKKAIVVSDYSETARAAVKILGELLPYGISECLFLECLHMGVEEYGSVAYQQAEKRIEKGFAEYREELEKSGIKTDSRIVLEPIRKEVVRIAEEEDASLIVVGAESRNLVSEPLLGGLAFDIIHSCRKPVLIVRVSAEKKGGVITAEPVRSRFSDHILFPTDFSVTAGRAFDVVKEMVASGVRKVTLMHVQEETRISPYLLNELQKFNEIDDQRLQDMRRILQDIAPVDVDMLITYGNAVRDILRTVKERDVQLVVMGSQGRGYVRDLFLGSVGHNLARQSEASVLLIPAADRE